MFRSGLDPEKCLTPEIVNGYQFTNWMSLTEGIGQCLAIAVLEVAVPFEGDLVGLAYVRLSGPIDRTRSEWIQPFQNVELSLYRCNT